MSTAAHESQMRVLLPIEVQRKAIENRELAAKLRVLTEHRSTECTGSDEQDIYVCISVLANLTEKVCAMISHLAAQRAAYERGLRGKQEGEG